MVVEKIAAIVHGMTKLLTENFRFTSILTTNNTRMPDMVLRIIEKLNTFRVNNERDIFVLYLFFIHDGKIVYYI